MGEEFNYDPWRCDPSVLYNKDVASILIIRGQVANSITYRATIQLRFPTEEMSLINKMSM
jgi:hypothetical protein